MDGRAVGIVANQPLYIAGTLDVKACFKASRFYNFCDAFGIPLIFLVDIPGFFPSPESEINGIIRWSTRMLYEIAHATVPKITVMIRKAYGLGAFGMCTPHFRPEGVVAWPTAQGGAISPEDAVDILYRRKLAECPDKEKVRSELIRDFEERMRIDPAVEAAFYEDVIDPRDTRRVIIKALDMAKRRQEGFTFKRRGITPI
jgi:propionyl-CoA carboxylase beta chain